MKYVGIFFATLGTLLAVLLYKSALSHRAIIAEELRRLVTHIRARVSDYLEPPAVWAKSFVTDIPEVEKMLSEIRGGSSTVAAFNNALCGISLPVEIKELLSGFFSRLGSDSIASERREILKGEERLVSLLEREKKRSGESGTVASVIAFLVLAGGIIIVI